MRPPPRPPLVPYTTLFRSVEEVLDRQRDAAQRTARLAACPRRLGQARLLPGPLDAQCPEGAERGVQRVDSRRERVDDLDRRDRKSTRLNSSHLGISYAVFC